MKWLRICGTRLIQDPRRRPVRRLSFRPHLEWLEYRRAPAAHDTLSTALPLSFAASPTARVSDSLTTANQVNLYTVTLHQGDQFSAAVTARQQGSLLTAALRLFDSSGAELSATASSLGGDPRLTYHVSAAGTYYVGVSSSGDVTYVPTTGDNRIHGNSTGLYSLSVTDLLARFVNAAPLNSAGQVLQGTLTGGQPRVYRVTVSGAPETFLVATAAPVASPGFEPRLTLYDETSQLLIQSDRQKPDLASATVEQHLQTGTYYLEVSAAPGSSAAPIPSYQLTTALEASLPPFAPLPVGLEPDSVAMADFGNGRLDIVAANTGDNTVSVLLGNGDGTFQPAKSFSVGKAPEGVAVADVNGDGRLDIVTANSGDRTVSVLLGNGDGTFQPVLSFAVGSVPFSVAVANLGNGHVDIVTANRGDNTVSVLLGDDAGTFQPAHSFAVGIAPIAVAVADVTGDGRLDIVTANSGDSTVSVLPGNGDGMFQAAKSFIVGSAPFAVAIVNPGTAHPDIVVANSRDNTVSVLRNKGDGTFQPAQSYAVGNTPSSVAVKDLGNGRSDIVTANQGDNTVSVLPGNDDGTFQSARSFAVGNSPIAVAVADLGNGSDDIVVANAGNNTLSVLLGNDDGTFQSAQSFTAGSQPEAVAVADLGNGRPDIITADAANNTVSVLLGNGNGTFQPAQSFAVGSQPEGVALADVNGDGFSDIVTSNYGDNTVSVLLGSGDGTFQPDPFSSPGLPPGKFSVGSEPFGITVADLGNGHADIVTTNFGDNTVSVLLGDGGGMFQPDPFSSPGLPPGKFSVGSKPLSVAAGDLGNGHVDIVTANSGDNTVSVLLGNGNGTFQPALSFAVGSQPEGVAVADLGNGHADIVTADAASNKVSVLLGNGNGSTFQPAKSFGVGSVPYAVVVADRGNGPPDIVTANFGDNTVSVLRGNGDGTFQPAQSYEVGNSPSSVAVADLGNGRPDIVTANSGDNAVSVLPGNNDGTFQLAQSIAVGLGPITARTVDLGNGQVDIVTTNYVANTVSVSLGNGDGAFGPAQSFAVGSGPVSASLADLNGDARYDIVTANAVANTVSVLLGNGDGILQPAKSFSVGFGPVAVTVADLGNGQADIITANYGAGTVSVLLGNGDGTFQPAHSFPVGKEPESVTVGDLGNGRQDIVVANHGANTVSVLLGNGDGTFQPAVFFAVGRNPESVALADLGNGQLDIITANYGDDTVSVLLGAGNGRFQPAHSYAVGSLPHSIAVADLGNGHPDIVVADYGDNTVSLLLGDGNGTFHPALFVGVGSLPESVAVADVNNDGRHDIVTANAGVAGTVSVLLNLGNVRFQAPAATSGIPSRDIPRVQDLTGDGIPDAVSLDQHFDQILFRQGVGKPENPFAPLVVVNPGRPATDFILVQTQGLPEIAALDSVDQQVFLYAWSSSSRQFQQIGAFATGPQPVRIASADLDGNGLSDLVVGNDLDNTLTIGLQQSRGTFGTFTRNVGGGPSSIAVADCDGDGLLDIVVSDQVSGDVTLLLNDPGHSFTTRLRYRAGQDPFDVNLGPNGATLLTRLQTVGVVAADFSGNGSADLVAINANAHRFSLLRAAGSGSMIDPQPADTYLVGPGAVQALAGDFLHDGRQDLAVLTTAIDGASQIQVFLNIGNGAFGELLVSAAGEDATGFSFLPGTDNQPDRLVVGNDYGDFLILQGDGAGHFVVDRSKLNGQPLAVIQQKNEPLLVVLADEQTGQVRVFVQSSSTQPGTGFFTALGSVRVPISSITQVAPAPGSVLLTDINGDGIPDLLVADRLGNDILVFQGNATGTFSTLVYSIPVGFEPDAIVVGDFNSDGVADLAVANQGSNDVSILNGALHAGQWTSTHGPRLSSGGIEPLAIATGFFTGRPGILDLRVTNAGGQIATLPGVGATATTSGGTGKGTGFFRDNAAQISTLGSTIVEVAFDSTTGKTFVVLSDGVLESFDGATFTPDFRVTGVIQVSADQGELAVGLENGVEVLDEVGGAPEVASEDFSDQPEALQVLQTEEGLEVVVTVKGSDVPLLLTGFTAIPVVIDLPRSDFIVEATSLPEANLVLVATLLAGDLMEPTAVAVIAGQPIGGEQFFELFLPVLVTVNGANAAPGCDDEAQVVAVQPAAPPLVQGANTLEWQNYQLGAEAALADDVQRQKVIDNLMDVIDVLKKMVNKFKNDLNTIKERIHLERQWSVELAAPEPVQSGEEMGQMQDTAARVTVQQAAPDQDMDLFARLDLLPREIPLRHLKEDSNESWFHEPLPLVPDNFLRGQVDRAREEACGEERAAVIAALLLVSVEEGLPGVGSIGGEADAAELVRQVKQFRGHTAPDRLFP